MSQTSSSSTKRRGWNNAMPALLFSTVLLFSSPSGALITTTPSVLRSFVLQSSTIMAPADLTPAIDKFVRLPTGPNVDPYFMTAKGPVPVGPEPFALVSDELQPLSDYVKELVVSENPVLTMAASHFFEKVPYS